MAATERRVLELLEAAGGRAVGDDLCTGMRSTEGEVDAGAGTGEQARTGIEALLEVL